MADARPTASSPERDAPCGTLDAANQTNSNLYVANFSLLFAHQIDSAYWHEWNLFHLPGGIQLFVVVNLALLLVALCGFRKIVRGDRAGYWFALVLAAAGLFAFVFHAVMLSRGHPEFRLPVSIALLVLIAIVSLPQAVGAVVRLRRL